MGGTRYPRPYRPDSVEGAQAELGASGPMPVGARADFVDHVNNAGSPKTSKPGKKRPKLRIVRREDADAVADPVVASEVVAALEDFADLEPENARREAALKAAPLSDAEKAAAVAAALAHIAAVFQAARTEGVRFKAIDPDAAR